MAIESAWLRVFWCSAMLHLVILSTSKSDDANSQAAGSFEWTAWSSWGPCSRTCGGGLSAQTRNCIPRHNDDLNGTLAPPIITVRVTRQIAQRLTQRSPKRLTQRSIQRLTQRSKQRLPRQVDQEDCPGVSQRYHQCNTKPCPGDARAQDPRAAQCSAYDRRPFRGRFYTWVPYIDGNAPCVLHCRPLGQRFYAALALVADGAPCTRPGHRALCLRGTCQVVGRESILAGASDRQLACGSRLVSGLFSRPKLPLGYSYVTTVPRGACRINVSEGVPSENFIALKITNQTFIFNGEFAISPAGSYQAAGTQFQYARYAGQDTVYAAGPLQEPVDIMILYTQPGSNIKYEYLTDVPDVTNSLQANPASSTPSSDTFAAGSAHHGKRHRVTVSEPLSNTNVPKIPYFSVTEDADEAAEDENNSVGFRRFEWKIISYSPCTRSCGGGMQIGKYRCVEEGGAEAPPAACAGAAPPAGRRRRCGAAPCTPRWRAAPWGPCPACGPATTARRVGCVQDHARGIIKISDQKCPQPKPATVQPCAIPDCVDADVTERDTRRDHVDSFRDGPVYTIALNNSSERGPSYSVGSAAGWLYTEWSECVGWCVGGGVQTRHVRCSIPGGCGLPSPSSSSSSSLSSPALSSPSSSFPAPPATVRACRPAHCPPQTGAWFVGSWSACSAACGGRQVRGAACVGGSGRHLRDHACPAPRPATARDCGPGCTATWHRGDWAQCISNCSAQPPTGWQRRMVVCGDGERPGEGACPPPRPADTRPCTPHCASRSAAGERRTTSADDQQSDFRNEQSNVISTTIVTTSTPPNDKEDTMIDCEDKLNNCALAVQARLCHYNFYVQNCCRSCHGT